VERWSPANCAFSPSWPAVRPGVRQFGRVNALFNLAATAYLYRLEDISDEEWNHAAATRSTSSGGMKVW